MLRFDELYTGAWLVYWNDHAVGRIGTREDIYIIFHRTKTLYVQSMKEAEAYFTEHYSNVYGTW